MVIWLMVTGRIDEAKDLFLAILPVSAAVVSFWFAGRSVDKTKRRGAGEEQQKHGANDDEGPH